MLALTTPITVPNISRIKVTAFTPPDLDVSDYMTVVVSCLCPPAGQTDIVQLSKAYGPPQVLKVRNGNCDAISFSSDATVNPYSALITRSTIVSATLLDTCVAAIAAAGNNIRHQLKALETALSTAGALPAGTVA